MTLAPHYELAYEEAKRALDAQLRRVDRLQSASGILIAAAAVTTSFFGGGAFARGDFGIAGWSAIVCFGLVGVMVLIVLWPGYRWDYGIDPLAFLVTYVENRDGALGLPEIHRDLALYMDRRYMANTRRLQTLTAFFTIGAWLLVCEVVAWMMGIVDGT